MKKNLLSLLFISAFVFFFFYRLFLPHPGLIITPEFGRGDISHLNLPLKYLYSQALSHGTLPFWSSQVGAGYPFFAESQSGHLYIVNLILFGLLPFWLAYNLAFITSFLIAGFGMYFLLREYKKSYELSIIGALLFSFSGFFIGHINHLNMLQTSVLMPFVVLLTDRLIKKPTIREFSLLTLLLSQQILAGHIQMVFIQNTFLIAYCMYHTLSRKIIFRNVLLVTSASIGALVLSAIQLIPSLDFMRETTRAMGFSYESTVYFSFHPKHLITFLNPFLLGSPADGSYPVYTQFNGSIFWENSPYFTIVGLLGFIFSLKYIKNAKIIFLFLTGIFFLLVAFGKFSPLYILFTAPPFSLFTTPARFILIVVFVCVVASIYGLDKFSEMIPIKYRKVVAFTFLALIIIDISVTWQKYHPVVPFDSWMKKPFTAEKILESNSNPVVYGVHVGSDWYRKYITDGWKKPEEYLQYRNELSPNQNLLWGVSQYYVYTGRAWFRRSIAINELVNNGMYVSKDSKSLFVSTESAKLLAMGGVTHLTSDMPITSSNSIVQQARYSPSKNRTYYVYSIINALPLYRFADSIFPVETERDIIDSLNDKKFKINTSVLVDKGAETSIKNLSTAREFKKITPTDSVQIVKDSELKKEFITSTKGEKILVMVNSYYDQWKATIDNKPAQIFPVNINQQGLIVPSGQHKIRVYYDLRLFYLGALISGIGYLIFITLIFVQVPFHTFALPSSIEKSLKRRGSTRRTK